MADCGSSSVRLQHEYAIGGVTVRFPCKPYRTQMAMMAKIIMALTRGENALLESPTGSGKTLALLCSALAWQRNEHRKMSPVQAGPGSPQEISCSCSCHDNSAAIEHPTPTPSLPVNPTSPPTAAVAVEKGKEAVEGTNAAIVATDGPPYVLKEEGGCHNMASPSEAGGEEEGGGGKEEGGGGEEEGGEGEKEDDSLEDDFKKTKKRFRTPSAAGPTTKKRKRKGKGVVYNDPSEGGEEEEQGGGEGNPPVWKMELKSPTANSLGVAPSQIMDTGVAGKMGASVGGCGQLASCTPCHKCSCSSPGHPTKHSAAHAAGGKHGSGNKHAGVPKIYFGSRTHKQIAQLTHELAKTAYSGTQMCILASREHTCIHPDVSRSRSKNEECRKLLRSKDNTCMPFHRVQQKLGSQAQLQQHGYTTAWDIEDLVQLGRKTRACPYYATRALLEEADLVFCPYNYLIDPSIREQMLVDLRGQVVIFDEGHNMEDSAREAASLTVTSDQFTEVYNEITELLVYIRGGLELSYKYFQALCQSLVQWIETTGQGLPQRSYEQACGIWSGKDFLPVLQQMGITPHTFTIIVGHLEIISKPTERRPDNEEEDDPPMLSMPSMAILKNLCIVLTYLFKENMRFLPDYRFSLIKVSTTRWKDQMFQGWRRRGPEKVWSFRLNFWCLNPAVAFSEMTCSRSIILTSGTLSPMSSFSSELGVVFPIQLEASHIIPETQTWIHTLSHGPNGNSLIANYQNSETYEFQDEVGLVVLRVCQAVPYGVLCFLSSYKMLEKLSKRWQETGLWARIEETKCTVSEPRSGEKADFEAAMLTFYQVVRDCHESGCVGGQTGALFLAVCRGKVSEGLDFSNDNARAVITVGIPFPNIKDKQVELKREYNNEHCNKRGLLTGSEWYEIQAYRALNQALGRCLRHKKDWGALVLVDERFSKGPRYTKGLSKWVRQRVRHERSFEDAMSSLRAFADAMVRADSDQSLLDGSHDPSSTSLSVTADQFPTTSGLTSPNRHPLPSPCLPITPSHSSPLPDTSTPIAQGKVGRVLPPSILPSPSHPPPSPLLPISKPSHRPTSSTQLTLKEALFQQNTALLNMSASRNFTPSSFPTFLYPGGVHIASPPLQVSLVDITNVGLLSPPKKEASSSVLTDQLTQEEQCRGAERDKDKPSLVPETPPLSPTAHSPLLFESCGKPPSLMLVSQVSPAPEGHLGEPEEVAAQGKEEAGDDDITPPITPRETTGQVLPHTPVAPQCLDSTKPADTAPFGQPQRNVRVAKRRGEGFNGLGAKLTPIVIEEEDEDFKARKNRIPRARRQPKATSDDTVVTCLCGRALTGTAVSEKLELKEAFSKRYARHRVAAIQASRLWRLLKGNTKRRTLHAHVVPATGASCAVKEGQGDYNAVWDETLGLCYSHLLCQCGEVVGVTVHSSACADGLVGKALFSADKTSMSP